MKMRMMNPLASLTAAVLLCSATRAWTTPTRSSFTTRSLSSFALSSSTLPQQETTTATPTPQTTSSVLTPDYAQALEKAKTQLSAMVPEAYHAKMMGLLVHFCTEYMVANQQAHLDDHQLDMTAAPAAAQRFAKGVQYALQYGVPQSPDHYTFDVSHTAQRNVGPDNIDFYAVGCAFFHAVMELTSATVNTLGEDNIEQAMEQLDRGENVVFFANHQSEADPQVVSSCFNLLGEQTSEMAANMIYVAGHKVTTDALAIPFSMGRNLICIHSKKHIDADPDTKPTKQRQNLKAMSGLLNKFKQGGACIWVAPSGGRDRRDPETGAVPLAPFDSKTIDMFRLMGNKSRVKTHYYTMAMVSYDLCPPPDTVEAGVGEARNVRYVPVGVALGKQLESVGGLETRKAFCQTAMSQCQADYEMLLESLETAKQLKLAQKKAKTSGV